MLLMEDNMRNVKIFLSNFKLSLLRDMSHKVNFLMRFISDSVFIFVYFVFYSIIYSYVSFINEWSKYEVILLMGTFHIVLSVFLAFFFPNLIQIPRLIIEGRLDEYLLRPVKTQFLVSFRYIDIGSLGNIILGVILVINSYRQLGLSFSLKSLLLYIMYILMGSLIMYSILFIFLSTAFWVQDSSWSIGFFMTLNSFADKPLSIFRGVLYRFLVYLFPIGLVANIPASSILEKDNHNLNFWIIIITIALLRLSNYIWRRGLNLYEGASS